MKKIVTVIGGGTGTFIVLQSLKTLGVEIKAIVSMMDSGGSTGRLRDQLGVLPPGDLRQCLVALSDAPLLWRKLFLYRFENGDLKGHNFGNIFLSALEKITPNYQEVITAASHILKTRGEVIPVTFDKTHLIAQLSNGKIVKGEGKIDLLRSKTIKIIRVFLNPKAKANPIAIKTILNSDYLVIGPGDLYTSLIPPLLVNNIKENIKKTSAKIIYILNLMTKKGQTTEFTAHDHLRELLKYLGRKPDFIIINNGKIPKNILKWYLGNGEKIVVNDLNQQKNITLIIDDVIDNKPFYKEKGDKLYRSLLRHSYLKLRKVFKKIIND